LVVASCCLAPRPLSPVDVVDIIFDGVVITVAIVGASVVGRLVGACVNVVVVTATAVMWRTAFGG
jgi:hypothetical protein